MGMMANRNVIVTGCGSEMGMGWATAVRCAREGANVMVTDLNGEKLGDLVEELRAHGVQAASTTADITDREQVNAVVDQAVAEFGGVDGLVNNAGTAAQNSFVP